jgi:predicted DNA-binding transcriptional regulator AlpA
MAEPQHLRLDPGLIDEIVGRLSDVVVERVVEAIRAEGIISQASAATTWLDAKEVAELLGVERDWVYEHAEELGASRLGTGPRPRLRFPPQILEHRSDSRTSANAASPPSKRRPRPSGLIPIHAS